MVRNGKGSQRRPRSRGVSREEYDLRYDLAMGNITYKQFNVGLDRLTNRLMKEINDDRETHAADKPQ